MQALKGVLRPSCGVPRFALHRLRRLRMTVRYDPPSMDESLIRSTTVLCVRRDGAVAMAGDGQVTVGTTVMKHGAAKVRRLYHDKILAGFAGSAADAFALFSRFEAKLEEYRGNMERSVVELAKDWRMDKYLRQLQAFLIVANAERVPDLRHRRSDSAGRRHPGHRFRRAVRAGRGARADEAHGAECGRHRRGSAAHCGDHLHLYERSDHCGKPLTHGHPTSGQH